METETGLITAVKQHDKKYGVVINKQWYNGFGKCSFEKGDNVKIDFEENGKFRNIKTIKKQETTQNRPGMVEDIHLQVCLKAAAQVFSGTKATPAELANYSRSLMKELWG